jgi:hypothetical protein
MWLLWLKHRWRDGSALLIAVLAIVLVVLFALGRSIPGISHLGDASAARPSAGAPSGAVLPRSGVPVVSLLDTDLPSSRGPQTIAEAQAAWSTAEIAVRQQQLFTAINCTRQQQGQTALTLDPALRDSR